MDQLNDILSSLSPDDIQSIKSMADSIFGGNSGNSSSGGTSESNGFNNSFKNDNPDNPFANIDPAMMANIAALMNRLNSKKNDSRVILLQALKPMLSEKRKKRTDDAIKYMGLIELLPELKNLNIF